MNGAGEGEGDVSPPWHWRDLVGSDRWLALGTVVVVLVPFVIAIVRGFGDGWIPSGDNANIVIRALDVFSRHPPLTGLPSTSVLYGETYTNHPGPIEFYLLAAPVRVLGVSAGAMLGAAAINATFVLIALWVFFRRLGVRAMAFAGVLLLAVMWAAGSSVLIDPVSSNMTMYSLLATFVLAWALLDGDVALLPLAAFVASYAAQQHLAAGVVVAIVVAVALVGLAVQVTLAVRRGDRAAGRAALRWTAVAFGVAIVCWAPVLYEQLTRHPGNLTAIVQFARNNARPKLGLRSGLDQVVRVLTLPTIIGRSDTTGGSLLASPTAAAVGIALAIIGALVVVTIRAWRTARSVALLALVALVVLAAGAINGSNVPQGSESARINLYRWSFGGAFLAVAALGLGLGLVARRWSVREGASWGRRLVSAGLAATAVVLVVAIVFGNARDDHSGAREDFVAGRRVADAVVDRVDRHHPVLVVAQGLDSILQISPYVIARLVEAGAKVQVSEANFATLSGSVNRQYLVGTYGKDRVHQPGSRPATLVITSGKATRPSGPGALVAVRSFGSDRARFREVAAARGALLDELSTQARSAPVQLAPGVASSSVDASLALLLKLLPTSPRSALSTDGFLKFVLAGGLRSPVLDPVEVRRLLTLPALRSRTRSGAEQVEVRLIPPGADAIVGAVPVGSRP